MKNQTGLAARAGLYLSLLCGMLPLLAPLGLAQGAGSSLSGRVVDQTGGVVPGVTILLINTATQTSRVTASNQQGLYSFQALRPGTYDVHTNKSGFASVEEDGVVLNANESRRLTDIKLGLATVSQKIVVKGAAVSLAPVNTGESRLTLNSKMVSQLSIEGRDALELVKFMPGMALNSGLNNSEWSSMITGTNTGPGGNFSANGTQPDGAMAIISDGGNLIDPGDQGTQIANVNQDNTAQMTIMNSSFDAEYPRGPIVIQATGKSGGAHYHGEAYLYSRLGQYNAEDSYMKSQGSPKPHEHYYYPGFEFGGPVPGMHKKLFFDTGYEYMDQHPDGTLHELFVPTSAMLAGNFTPGYLQSLGVSNFPIGNVPCADPNNWNYSGYCGTSSGQAQVLNGQINPNAMDPNALALAKLFPAPNMDPASHNGYNYSILDNAPVNRWEYRIRTDWSPTENTRAYLSYDRQHETDHDTFGVWWWPTDTLPYPGQLEALTVANSWSAGVTHVFSPTLTNEFTFAYNSYINPVRPKNSAAVNPSKVGYTAQGVYSPNIMPEVPNLVSWGCMTGGSNGCFPGFYGPAFASGFDNGAFGAQKRVPSLSDNLSWVKGTHFMKFGGYWDSEGNDQTSGYGSWPQGAYEFDTWGQYSTNNPIADFLLGKAANYSQTNADPVFNMRYHEYAVYAQDQWQVTPKMTLNYGVRFNHEGAWYWPGTPGLAVWDPSTYNNGSNPPAWTGLTWHAQNPSVPISGFKSMFVLPEPRFGVAYDLFGNGKTVLRGGFGLFQYQISNSIPSGAATQSLGIMSVTTPGLTSLAQAASFNGSAATGLFGNISAMQMNENRTPITETWDFIVSQRLPLKSELELEYTGNSSRNELISGNLANINQIPLGALFGPDPVTGTVYKGPAPSSVWQDYRPYRNYGAINIDSFGGYANYNALQATWQKQSGPVTFMLNYTFGKALGIRDGQTNDGYGAGSALDSFVMANNYGVLAYDRTHVFNAAYVINLPSPVHSLWLGKQVLDGWQLSGDTQLQSGPPLQPNTGGTMNVTWPSQAVTAAQQAEWPNGFGSSASLGTDVTTLAPLLTCDPRQGLQSGQYFNPNCFAVPAQGQQGNVIWPYIKGPAFFNSDLGLYKNFTVREKQTVQLRLTAFNFLNHPLPQFGLGNDVNLNFSQSNASGTNFVNGNNNTNGRPMYTVGRRVVEFALKYNF